MGRGLEVLSLGRCTCISDNGGWRQGVLTVPVALLVSCGILVGGSGRHRLGAVFGRVISIAGIVLVQRSTLVGGARRKGATEINLLPCG
jgi:hypothetical protein